MSDYRQQLHDEAEPRRETYVELKDWLEEVEKAIEFDDDGKMVLERMIPAGKIADQLRRILGTPRER